MFGCQQVLIKTDKDTEAILEYLCSESNDLYNCAVYYARQVWFKTSKIVSGFDLTAEMKTNRHFNAGYASSMQQTCISVNMGAKTNQNFVSVPTAKLKDRIAQLCQQYGILFEETEESYTSKASFLDKDELPKYGEKPNEWKSSGRRVKRGLFRTAIFGYINADCNGAANILRKVKGKFGLELNRLTRGVLTAPNRLRLWS